MQGVLRTPFTDQYSNLRNCGKFGYVNKLNLHSEIIWDAGQFMQWTLTQGSINTLIKHGVSLDLIGFSDLVSEVRKCLEDRKMKWIIQWELFYGIK